LGAIPIPLLYREATRESNEMEFYSPTYELLYKLETLGLCRPPKGWDLMHEGDIINHILLNTRRVDAHR